MYIRIAINGCTLPCSAIAARLSGGAPLEAEPARKKSRWGSDGTEAVDDSVSASSSAKAALAAAMALAMGSAGAGASAPLGGKMNVQSSLMAALSVGSRPQKVYKK